mmetsp:Transcript_10302/g.41609  ORF Transcript_10302/g.41609 Transcript_10302/m.41609 type:complete len:253 (-) Transcript_10302:356-1114(-)
MHDILCCLLSLHEEDRQMLGDGLLHSADVLSGDPILPGSAHKVLRTWASLGPVALCLTRLLRASGSQFLEEVRHLHHKHRAVVRVDPRLAVNPLHVVAATHRGWDQFVVFLQDLVARRCVEVCKLLDPQEFALHLVEGVPQMGNPLHSLRVVDRAATLLRVSQDARVGALRSARPRICRGSVRGELRQTIPDGCGHVYVQLLDPLLQLCQRRLHELPDLLHVRVEGLEESRLAHHGSLPLLAAAPGSRRHER